MYTTLLENEDTFVKVKKVNLHKNEHHLTYFYLEIILIHILGPTSMIIITGTRWFSSPQSHSGPKKEDDTVQEMGGPSVFSSEGNCKSTALCDVSHSYNDGEFSK